MPGDAEDLGWKIQIKNLVCLKSWQMVRFCCDVRIHNLQPLDDRAGAGGAGI